MTSLPEPTELRELLRQGRGVLALPGGGCARYVFSEDVDYGQTSDGRLMVRVTRGNPSYRDLVHRSGMNLHIVARRHADQTESLLLVLHGHLRESPPDQLSELCVASAYVEEESGQRTPINPSALGLRNGRV